MSSLAEINLTQYGLLLTNTGIEVVKTRLFGIVSQYLPKIWPKVWPLLQNAVDYSDGKYHINDVHAAIKARDMQLWVVYEENKLCAAIVTTIHFHPKKKTLFILFAAGFEIDKWLHVINNLEEYAKGLGCSAIECWGRPGWKKFSKQYGFEMVSTVFRKEI